LQTSQVKTKIFEVSATTINFPSG